MKIFFTEQALKDLEYWENNNKKIIRKIIALIEDVKRSPFSGIGKPEP